MNKNPRRNASGYMDMTAYQAIRAADKEIAKRDCAKRKHKNKKTGGKHNERN